MSVTRGSFIDKKIKKKSKDKTQKKSFTFLPWV